MDQRWLRLHKLSGGRAGGLSRSGALALDGVSASTFNARVIFLRFFFGITCGRDEMKRFMQFHRKPRKLPIALSVEEVADFVATILGLRSEGQSTHPYDLDRTRRRQVHGVLAGRSIHTGADVSEAKRLNTLEDENGKLKKRLAGAMLDNSALNDLFRKNGDDAEMSAIGPGTMDACAKRQAVAHLVGGARDEQPAGAPGDGLCRMTMR